MSIHSNKIQKCPICESAFNIFTKKFVCVDCEQTVCKSHLVYFNQSKICEDCEKFRVKSEFFPDVLGKITQLKTELALLQKSQKKLNIEILTKNDVLNKIEKQTRIYFEMHLERVNVYEKKIENEREKCESGEKLVKFLEQSLMESKKNEMIMVQKMNTNIQDLYRARMELEELTGTQKGLISKVDKLNFIQRNQVPINRLSLLSCSECKQKIRSAFIDIFELNKSEVSQGSLINSFLAASLIQDPQRTTDVCKVCLII